MAVVERGYEPIAPTFNKLAEKRFGQEFPPEVINAWDHLSRSMRMADHLIDTSQTQSFRERVAVNALGFLSGDNDLDSLGNESYGEEMTGLRDYLATLPDERRGHFFRNLKNLLKVTEELRTTESVRRFGDLTRLEGQISGRLFLNLLPDEYSKKHGYQEYHQIATRVGRAGNVFDTVIDLKDDGNNGLTLVTPSLRNRISLLMQSSGDAIFILRAVGPEFMGSIGRAALEAFRNKKESQRSSLKTEAEVLRSS